MLVNQPGWTEPWGAGNGEIVINGIGASSGSPLRADDIGGIASADSSGVLANSGFQTEDVNDLVVQLPGRDFVLTRSFTGTDDYNDWTLWRYGIPDSGGWTLSTDTIVLPRLEVVKPSDASTVLHAGDFQSVTDLAADNWKQMGSVVVRGSPARNTVSFQNVTKYRPRAIDGGAPVYSYNERREFEPTAASPARMLAEVYHDSLDGNVPIWALVTPGGGTTLFFREPVEPTSESGWQDATLSPPTNEAFPIGRIYKQFDEFGNVWTYRYGPGNATTGQGVGASGLRTIYLHGTGEDDAIAAVDFYWTATDPITNGTVSPSTRAQKIQVRRRNLSFGPGAWYRTHEVYYDYLADAATTLSRSVLSLSDIGQWPSDLVQVTFRTALNAPASTASTPTPAVTPEAVNWHSAVTQYRYAFSGKNSGDMKRQIKAIFTPRQVEQLVAIRGLVTDVRPSWSVAGSASYFLEAGAVELIGLVDTAPIESGTNGRKLWHFASKYVQHYLTPNERKGQVMREYSMPGPHGHTKLVEYVVSTDPCVYENYAFLQYDPDGPAASSLAPIDFQFYASLQTSREYVRRTDIGTPEPLAALTTPPKTLDATGPDANEPVWQARSIVKRRTEDRPMFFLSWINNPTPTMIPLVAQVTTAESRTELNPEPGAAPRTWITKYVFDRFNRSVLTYRPEAVRLVDTVTYQQTRLRNCELWVNDGLLGAVEGTVYADEIGGAGQISGTTQVERTQRIGDSFRGVGTGVAEALTHTLYVGLTATGRIDLPTKKFVYRETPTASLSEDKKEVSTYSYTVDATYVGGNAWSAGSYWHHLSTRLLAASEQVETDPANISANVFGPATAYTFAIPATSTVPQGQLATVVKPDGSYTAGTGLNSTTTGEYVYDKANGRVAQVSKHATGSTTEVVTSSAVYDLMGRRLAVTTPNGEKGAWRYGVSNLG